MSLRTTIAGALISIGSIAVQPAFAADDFWIGGTSGTQSWGTNSNWSLGHPPEYLVYPPDSAIIGDATGVRDIRTTTTTVNVLKINMSQGAAAPGVVNKLTLDGDFNVIGAFETHFVNDSSNSPSQMVFDLNGHTFTGYLPGFDIKNMTIRNSGAPGTGKFSTIYGMQLDTATIENNVTVETLGAFYGGGTWQPGSKLVVLGSQPQYGPITGGLQDVDFGTSASSTQADMYVQFFNEVHGDLTIYAPTNGNPLQFSAPYLTLSVGGNFVDHGSIQGAPYNPATLIFNGAPASAKTVQIRRSLGSGTNILVGNSGTDFSNIALAYDLVTGGQFRITNGSSIDLGQKVVSTSLFQQLTTAGATGIGLATSISNSATGHVAVDGNLTLNDFSLFVTGSWTGVHDLVLFTYTGTLSGTPNLTSLTFETFNGQFHYDALVYGGGEVKLTNVWVPEPATAGLLALGGAALSLRRSRRGCR